MAQLQNIRLRLDPTSELSFSVVGIIQRWDALYIEVLQKYQKILLQLLITLEFSSKMDTLRSVLADLDGTLKKSSSSQTNFDNLVQCQKAFDVS